MKLKKNYLYSSKRQIWRLIPTNTNKLIIEERDLEKKQVFFNCFVTDSGKKIFIDFQPEENFWVGIESVYDDVIFFHKFSKPDMPGHKGIMAFNISSQKLLWKNDEQNFLFVSDEILFCFTQNFESRKYHALNFRTGQSLNSELSEDKINELRKQSLIQNEMSGYLFPQPYYPLIPAEDNITRHLSNLKNDHLISGKIEYLVVNNLLLLNFHEIAEGGSLKNLFKAVDLTSGKYILEEVLVSKTPVFIPESFFIKDDLLFLLIEKTKLGVYRLSD